MNRTIQKSLTPAAGKRLIAMALAARTDIDTIIKNGKLVIVAGTTNGFVAEEILKKIGVTEGFDRSRFFRGIALPASRPTTEAGRLQEESGFMGDVVIAGGRYQAGTTLYDIADELRAGDIILKGANAVNLEERQAGILIGHHKAGTIGVALQAAAGRRVQLILPVGLEKRVSGGLNQLAALINAPTTSGPRLLPVPGEIFTELEALRALTGAEATLIAGGGVAGAEGSVWLAVTGTEAALESASVLMNEVAREPNFEV
jgi:hypothetical protein